MSGVVVFAIMFLSIAIFALTAMRHGIKRAISESDEWGLGGILLIFLFGGLLAGVYILNYFIPKSQIEFRIISFFVFMWIWGAIYLKFGDFLNK
jgi:hypothetical protein